MRNIVGIIGVLAAVYFGAPKVACSISEELRRAVVEQSSKKKTPLTKISNRLTSSQP